jgi:hypothetical protein
MHIIVLTIHIGRSVKNLQSFFLIKAAFFVDALFFFLDFQCARGSILAFLNCSMSNSDTPSKSIIMLWPLQLHCPKFGILKLCYQMNILQPFSPLIVDN